MRKDMDQFTSKALIYKAYCDENRLRIIDILTLGEHCACDLLEQLPIGQSTLSHHMKILVDSGIVSQRKNGKWVYYSLNDEGCKKSIDLLNEIVKKKYDVLSECDCNVEVKI
jgi:ArsR family transcriptional regulator